MRFFASRARFVVNGATPPDDVGLVTAGAAEYPAFNDDSVVSGKAARVAF